MTEGLLSLLADLVKVDSTSSKSNAPMLDALEPRLKDLGFSTERHRYQDDHGLEKANLLATLGSGVPELALVGHTDCVPFDPSWSEALKLVEREGKLYGRGACDTKAFIACALTAAERVKGKLNKPLLLAFTADEEVGCLGAKKLLEAGKGRARHAIVGEPTQLQPIRANKGYCLAELEIRGKEGHSAYPDSGASAVFRAARFLARLEAYAQGPLRAEQDDAFLPPFATLNVGVISGGTAKNVIPGRVKMTVEWRPIPSQQVETVLKEVERALEETKRDDPSMEWTLKPLRMDRGFATAPEAELVKFLEKESGKTAGTVAFGTEGPQLAALGAQPVVFGPGDIKVAHQNGEFCPKVELVRAEEVLEAALLRFCG
jgi:acetylornithine deacetylase